MKDSQNEIFSIHIQWNDFSKDTSVAESHGFNIMFQIFLTTVDDRKYLGDFPIHFIFGQSGSSSPYKWLCHSAYLPACLSQLASGEVSRVAIGFKAV